MAATQRGEAREGNDPVGPPTVTVGAVRASASARRASLRKMGHAKIGNNSPFSPLPSPRKITPFKIYTIRLIRMTWGGERERESNNQVVEPNRHHHLRGCAMFNDTKLNY